MKFSRLVLSLLLLSTISFTSCIKKDFDSPPDQNKVDPNLKVTYTIAKLLDKYPGWRSGNTKITDPNIVIQGIVTADDRSGNLYKEIFIDDTTAGLQIKIDGTNLYNDYPVGRKVYIKCTGLYLSNYGGAAELGYTLDASSTLVGFAPTLMGTYIVKATFPNKVRTIHATLQQLADSVATYAYTNRLVTIDSAEFAAADAAVPYADLVTIAATTKRTIEDCSGANSVILYNSAYANFQPYFTARGRGSITAIYTVFNATGELLLRDTTDVKFTGARCDGLVIAPPTSKNVFKEGFDALTTNTEVFSVGWVNYAEVGTKVYYVGASTTGDKYAKVTAFGSGEPSEKTWLITPAIDISSLVGPVLSFKSADGYDNGATLKVLVSFDYSGSGDPTTATWTELTGVTIATGQASGYSKFISSGSVPLPTTSGTIHIAFKYEGSDPSQTTTYEIDNVSVDGN